MRAEGCSVAVLGLALSCVPAAAVAGGPDAGRQQALEHLLAHDCGSCHGMRLTGGLGPPLTREVMATRPLESLERVIAGGIPGTPMPPWLGILDRDEIRWLAERLHRGYAGE